MTDLREKLLTCDQQVEILIGGIPGSMKTSLANALAAELGISMTGCDQLRCMAQQYDPNPFLQGSTHTRWQLLGSEEEYLLEGFRRQVDAMQPILNRVREYHQGRGEHSITEGVHIVPGISKAPTRGLMVLMKLDDPELEEKRMQIKLVRDSVEAAVWDHSKTKRLQEIERYLLEQAQNQALVIDSHQSLEECKQQVLDQLKMELK